MSRRTAAWLAWSLGGVCVALIALGLLLDFVTDELGPPGLAKELLDPALPVLTAVLSPSNLTVASL